MKKTIRRDIQGLAQGQGPFGYYLKPCELFAQLTKEGDRMTLSINEYTFDFGQIKQMIIDLEKKKTHNN